MMTEIQAFFEFLFGVYQPVMTEVQLPLYTITETGEIYLSSYMTHTQVVEGLGAWNIPYILSFIVMMYVYHLIIKQFSFMAYRFFGEKKRKIF